MSEDREEQSLSADQICVELGINCIVFHYQATQEIPPLNEKIADLQMHVLVKDHRWISDKETEILLQK